ncbi:DUF3885 domain-containing protein [Cytophaga aurantiaca]|uniref:DUF3885 domain-containing protein n=1 Tax=Cytophaga aurantiaca TaxID=29530 RepID=UPI00037BF7A6|nr:hypothetical protein [Cytophaga aurantiaca]
MTSANFIKYWNTIYPDSYPIDYELKTYFKDRWFRIHYLPDSKRYAENKAEYECILNRQNTLITDLFHTDDFIITLGLFKSDLSAQVNDDYSYFNLNDFIKVDTLALHQIRPLEYSDYTMYYEVCIKNEIWKSGNFNELLIKIADGETRAMFINTIRNIIVVPYDGGMDIILPDTKTRDLYKTKYKDWLSNHPDGL